MSSRVATLSCDRCSAKHSYLIAEINVRLYTHGVCALAFICRSCRQRTEFAVPDRVALLLDERGAPTTIVRTPDEVLEWPAPAVPPLTTHDVEVLERSSLRHLEECRLRELVDIPGANERLEGP